MRRRMNVPTAHSVGACGRRARIASILQLSSPCTPPALPPFPAQIANNGLDEDSVGRLKKKRRKSLWFILRRVLARIRGAHREILLLPTDRFRLAWDSVSITLVIFIVFSLPYRIAFDSGTYMEDPAVLRTRVWSADLATAQFQFIYLVDFCIDIFFLTDIGLNFITAYTIDGEVRPAHARARERGRLRW